MTGAVGSAVLSGVSAGSAHRGRDRGLRHPDRARLEAQHARRFRRSLLALGGAIALAGCTLHVQPPELQPVRWHADAVTVCAEPAFDVETAAATRAWHVGPELVYMGDCAEPAGIRVIAGKAAGGGEAETVVEWFTRTGAIKVATVYVDELGRGMDLQSIITHELGHAIGLDHTDVGNATMFQWIAAYDTSARDIDEEDERMVRALYGESER